MAGDEIGLGWVKKMSFSALGKRALALSGTALLSFLSACYSPPSPEVGMVPQQTDPALGQTGYTTYPDETYLLRATDVIDVSVFRENELSLNSVPISSDGEISFPLIGQVQAAGLTAGQLAARIEDSLGERYLREPDVTVNVRDYASHRVTIEGSVANSGLYNFPPGTRLSGGLALAGGPTRVADEEQVAIFRETPEGIMVAKFDYDAVQEGRMLDPVLEPSDRVVVGQDTLAQIYVDILSTLPTFAFFYRLAR